MIRVNNLTKYYNQFCAVDQISLDIKRGGILGLLGPNGAGKTTTLRMLTGYFKATSGTIHVKDYSIDENLLEIKKLMGYLPESAPLYHGMLVYDYLEFVAKIRGLDANAQSSRFRYLVETCGLNGIMHQSIDALSKGLKQRVGLAHAMMNDPEILILDEPTSGLDPNQIADIRSIIRQIGQEKTVILSTHILSEAEATCDRIVIINKGKIVADGTTDLLKETAAKERIIHICLEGAVADDACAHLKSVAGVTAVKASKRDHSDRLNLYLTCGLDGNIRKNLYQAIKQKEWILIEFRQEQKSLETIFRELTREN